MVRVLGNRYRLREMIGTGGMADVYLADDQRLKREVAVKILRSDLARDPSFRARFKKEALSAAALSHPGIVAVYDSGEDKESSYIVMELVEGQTLRDILKSGEKLSVHRALEIVAGILEALDYSHANGIIHRDIKPGNIMVTHAGEIKVMDFGIARAADDASATVTNTWNVVGTAQYLSPEQATGTIADQRSDIYSVGCLMYELLTGRPPFIGDTPVSIAYQHVSGEITPATSLNAALNPNIDRVLAVALSKDPAHRYQSADAMLDDVHRLMEGADVTTKIRKVIPRSRYAVLIAGIAVLIGLVVGALMINGSGSTTVYNQLPNVVGLTQDQAVRLLGGYTVNIEHAPDPRIPKDRIASQLPLATSKVPKGSAVTLTISDGPGNTTVPTDLVGKSLTDARNELSQAGLVVMQTIPTNSNSTPGTVLSVTPDGGSNIPAGSSVVLTIASGNATVPQVVGSTEIEAKTNLVQAGFLVKEITAYDAEQPINVVLAQAPASGSTQPIGSSVTITINQNSNQKP